MRHDPRPNGREREKERDAGATSSFATGERGKKKRGGADDGEGIFLSTRVICTWARWAGGEMQYRIKRRKTLLYRRCR